jgi:hypothetical protein
MLQYNSSGIAPSEVFMLPRDGDPDSAALDWDRMITGHPYTGGHYGTKKADFHWRRALQRRAAHLGA